jgi:hypothetical protein
MGVAEEVGFYKGSRARSSEKEAALQGIKMCEQSEQIERYSMKI